MIDKIIEDLKAENKTLTDEIRVVRIRNIGLHEQIMELKLIVKAYEEAFADLKKKYPIVLEVYK